MALRLPDTPGRGRSRFSNMLPDPPNMAAADAQKSPSSISTSVNSPLPPLPKDAMPPTKTIPRKPIQPVGRQPVQSDALTKSLSIASGSSIYSDTPGLSRTLSDSSSTNKDSADGDDSDAVAVPPIPPRVDSRLPPSNRPKTPVKTVADPISTLPTSPPRTEIWRRRSVKSDRSIVLADLKLDRSNGSTASPPRQEPPKGPLPHLPRSTTGQRKPVPARPAPPQPEFMGNKLAKLKEHSSKQKSESLSKDEATTPQYPTINRPPTPEYLKAEVQQSTIPQIASPASPHTPPDDAPPIPRRADSRAALTVPPISTSLIGSDPNHSRKSSEALTIIQPQPSLGPLFLTPQPSPSPDKTSPLVLPSPAAGPRILFPTLPSPAKEGTIFPGLALDVVHLDCYQSHKFMRGSKNTTYPVACMICQKEDMEMRWRCNWCCLSACPACMQVLASIPGKDLRVCLQKIGK